MTSPLARFSSPIILDGGLATELERLGYKLNHELWSAKLLVKAPEAIVQAHLNYLNAGAQCIISASYQASLAGFQKMGLVDSEAVRAMGLASKLANQAVTQFVNDQHRGERPLVAASVGPYGAILANGAEYHGRYGLSDEQLYEFHRQRLQLLNVHSTDIIAFETIPSWQEAQIVIALGEECAMPNWLSLSCQDGQHLNDGGEIEQVARAVEQSSNTQAIAINCSAIETISELISRIQSQCNKPILVYPNSGARYDATTKAWIAPQTSKPLHHYAQQWVQQGVLAVGGCCQIDADDIKRLSQHINQ
ncbi:homocysteine S-methyltransferase [Paraferrimonas haliotis]|nr:homocysteine S-methyltransferase [Paraferrimonas haliotis]